MCTTYTPICPSTEDDHVVVEKTSRAVRIIRLNRPAKLNALTVGMLSRIRDEISNASLDPTVRGIVLTGTGRAFSAGGDLSALDTMEPSRYREYMSSYVAVHRAVVAAEVPVVAAVNGYSFGGGMELTCMADIRIVDPKAIFCVADAAVGMVPTGALTWVLPRLVGPGRARLWMLANTQVTAEESLETGLCELRAGVDGAVATAVDLVETMATFPRGGLAAIRRVLGIAHSLEVAAEAEVSANIDRLERSDTAEAIARFLG